MYINGDFVADIVHGLEINPNHGVALFMSSVCEPFMRKRLECQEPLGNYL